MAASMREAFRGAVERILKSWTVLKLAVNHGFGGQDSQAKAEWMVHAVDQWFSENADIEPYELDDFLADVLNHEFDAVADDGSLREISQMICGCYKLCKDGNEGELTAKLSSLPQPAMQNCVQQHVQQDVEDGDYDNPPPLVQSSPQQSTSNQQQSADMETDEDGWQVVKKKSKR